MTEDPQLTSSQRLSRAFRSTDKTLVADNRLMLLTGVAHSAKFSCSMRSSRDRPRKLVH